jgi:hypothetical protein
MDEEMLDRMEKLLGVADSRMDQGLRLECCKLALKTGLNPSTVDSLLRRARIIHQYVKGKEND